jgi:hypothetical protein
VAGFTTLELWTNQKSPERKFLRGKWNLTVCRFWITTIHRAANCTMATEIQAGFSPEI